MNKEIEKRYEEMVTNYADVCNDLEIFKKRTLVFLDAFENYTKSFQTKLDTIDAMAEVDDLNVLVQVKQMHLDFREKIEQWQEYSKRVGKTGDEMKDIVFALQGKYNEFKKTKLQIIEQKLTKAQATKLLDRLEQVMAKKQKDYLEGKPLMEKLFLEFDEQTKESRSNMN